ncbi:MAG: flagellar hook-basal body protein [Firmicutes bacterium]|nr:flagellar hook-basal body protein [Bacillota bacterium]
MNASFYTAARGAMSQQEKMNVISNNMANTNTVGFKSKSAVFSDLMYCSMHDIEDADHGTGIKMERTNTNFTAAGFSSAGEGGYNYAIEGDGFFMVQDQVTGEISYTRAGNFSLSIKGEETNLITDNRKYVLDANRNPIRVVDGQLTGKPAVFTFRNTNDMQSAGFSEFKPVAKNGEPILSEGTRVIENYLEMSNVDIAKEMSDMIITSRAYSYALKMVQTSDEVQQTINGLR